MRATVYSWCRDVVCYLEPSESAVVAVQHQHGQRGELSRSVPAVTAVDHHRRLPGLQLISYLCCSCQQQLHTALHTCNCIAKTTYSWYTFCSSTDYMNSEVIKQHLEFSREHLFFILCSCARDLPVCTPTSVSGQWPSASGLHLWWDKPRPSFSSETPSSRGCWGFPGSSAQRSGRNSHSRTLRPLPARVGGIRSGRRREWRN